MTLVTDALELPRNLKKETRCRFCYDPEQSSETAVWNVPLAQTANFIVVPTLGSLVPGWVLVIPREHVISAVGLNTELAEELWSLVATVRSIVERAFGPAWVFEHGPSTVGHLTGCGVDHAHVHIVPFADSLVSIASNFLPTGVRFQEGSIDDCREAARVGMDYLFADAPEPGGAYVAVSHEFESQTFRKAIASGIGCPADYDWKLSDGRDHVDSTIRRLQSTLSDLVCLTVSA